ncbi:MAG TPA: sigma-70 family RNA polymerase sigma factor [Candidatus Binatia bacterium]|nr:sigma-70 family RNA polymerase sigma factor [Candidatus Binatia bacterium]
MESAREQALVAGARADGAAFGELYDFYLPRIYGFIARRVEDRAVAEDLTATTFERALSAVRRDDFRNASFGGFLYRVAANAVIDHARRERRSIPLGVRARDLDEDGDAERFESVADEAATRAFAAAVDRDVLRRALLRLPETHRRVVVLKYFDGLDADELCAALGCSRQTLAVKLHRALRALRGAVDREAFDAA